jgi:nitroreductase
MQEMRSPHKGRIYMDTIETIKKRRSVRSYRSKPVPKKILKELVELANLAPTASNLENRHFVVIQDKETIKKVYEAGCKQSHLLEAPVVIAVATDIKMHKAREFLKRNEVWGIDLWGARTKDYKNNKLFNRSWERWSNIWPIQDADTAITTLLLAATAKGIDSCWVGVFDFEEIKKILKLPKNYEVVALITLGYRRNPLYPQKRKPIKELLHWEQW